jgi:glyoxylase-like metal-dependent hydrolase (beta-lactamase superfamily II)
MVDIREFGEGIYGFRASIPGVDNIFSVYLLRARKGVLIEPGASALVPSILDAMKGLGIEGLSYIIPTHIHLDHGGAVGELSGLFPEAQVVVHPRGAGHLVEPSRLIAGTRQAFGPDFEESYGSILPVAESRVKSISDGEVLDWEGRELAIYYAPGHAPNHIVVFDKKTSGLFCGEALGAPKEAAPAFPLPSVAPPAFDMQDSLNTMERLLGLGPLTLYYSHDGVVGRDPERLIHCAMENIRNTGDIILESLNNGEDKDRTISRFQDYFFDKAGIRLERPMDCEMVYHGYRLYFEKRGLIKQEAS